MSQVEPQAKRQRSANYSSEEKTLLMSLVFEYRHIIECKKTDAVTWREKEAMWSKIAKLFNSQSPATVFRSVESLKKMYENQKKHVRKQVADEKMSIKKTGGGPGFWVRDPAADLTLAVINQKTVTGLQNAYDSDVVNTTSPANGPESETIILEIDQETECENENVIIDWGDYKPAHLKKPATDKLQNKPTVPEIVNETSSSQCTGLLNVEKSPMIKNSEELLMSPAAPSPKTWTSRRRPITNSLHSSDISKQYSDLSKIKLELATLELENFKATIAEKNERERIEFELRKQSLQLDILIKKANLKKILGDTTTTLNVPF